MTGRRPRRARPAAGPAALAALAALALPLVAAAGPGAPVPAGRVVPDGDGVCVSPGRLIRGTPWSLQRLPLDQLWASGRGEGVRVAVVDSGVDDRNPQLAGAVDAAAGADLVGKGGGTDDQDGHGTEVAGIIAARAVAGTGFVGIAPGATVVPIRETDAEGNGDRDLLAAGIDRAVAAHAKVINISQGTYSPDTGLRDAVRRALNADIVVVASAGNDGANGAAHTVYPAAYPGVLAVGASDRDDERAAFSQAGPYVGVAAPGVDMVSTVPVRGQCVDNGTSFSAPYVSGVAALLRQAHPGWSARQVVARIEQTAERPGRGRSDALGWGVVDPVKALTDDAPPTGAPTPDPAPAHAGALPRPAAYTPDEGAGRRTERDAVCALAAGVLALGLVAGGAVTVRDARRRRPAGRSGVSRR